MNRKSFISTLLGGIGLGIAAKEVIAADSELAPDYGVTGGGELKSNITHSGGIIGLGDVKIDPPMFVEYPSTWSIEIHGEAEEGQILYMNHQNGKPFDFIYRNGQWIQCFRRGGVADPSLSIKTVNA